jgi:SAM-dependent methyltransferase
MNTTLDICRTLYRWRMDYPFSLAISVDMNWKIRNIGAIIVDEFREAFIHDAFESIGSRETLLDLGCGNRPFGDFYEKHVSYSVGIDMPSSFHTLSVQVFGDATSLPFKNAVFDIVLCSEVMEHVREPEAMLREIRRVLRPGGFLVLTTPFMVPMHEEPHDYFRYTCHGLKYLCTKAELSVKKVIPFAEMNGVALSFFVETQLKFWNILSKAAGLQFLISVFNPFIMIFVYLPQKMYVATYRICEKSVRLRALINRLTHTTIGYGVVARKKT